MKGCIEAYELSFYLSKISKMRVEEKVFILYLELNLFLVGQLLFFITEICKYFIIEKTVKEFD
jgi:hypothetical protein